MINLTVNYHRPSANVDSQTVDGAYLVEDQVVPNGVNGLTRRHVVVFRQRRIKKNKYMAMAAIFFVIIVLLVAGLIAGIYHPGFESESSSSSSSSSPSSSSTSHGPGGKVPPSISQAMCGTRPGYKTRHKRVIHGRLSEKGQWPWQVFVRVSGKYVCGGVIVAPQWVFTAGHCVPLFKKDEEVKSSNIEVVAGSLHREEYEPGSQIRTAVRNIAHPKYSQEWEHFNYDILLLKMNESFVINDNVRTICLDDLPYSDLYAPGKRCVVAGWGFTSRREEFVFDESIQLSYAEVPLVDSKACHRFAASLGKRHELQVTPQRLCAGYEDNRQLEEDISVPCRGDSGSPLVCEDSTTRLWHLVGLVSSGPKCGEVSYFTNISAISDFWRIFTNESALPSSEFTCGDGIKSIPRAWMCDGVPDCQDMSDETQCDCTDRQFQCENKMCILNSHRCDSFDTCGDGSDERGCTYFNCSDGLQVAASSMCDGHFDCEDGSDESNDLCAYNSSTHFACAEGARIPYSWVCDGFKDCNSSEDEIGCNCSAHQFRCDNQCILNDRVCDNVIDCEDRTDEANCSCPDDRFYCRSAGLCWEHKMKNFCDGYDSYKNPCSDAACNGILDLCWTKKFKLLCEIYFHGPSQNDTFIGNGG